MPETADRPTRLSDDIPELERRGRRWLVVSFLLCPCHLPVTLGVLAAVSGGTALGAALRSHGWIAGLVIAAAWLAGTSRGFLLIRRGQRDGFACSLPDPGVESGELTPTAG